MSSNIFSRSVYFWTMQPSAFRYASFGYTYSALPYRPGLIIFSTVSESKKLIKRRASPVYRGSIFNVISLDATSCFQKLEFILRDSLDSTNPPSDEQHLLEPNLPSIYVQVERSKTTLPLKGFATEVVVVNRSNLP